MNEAQDRLSRFTKITPTCHVWIGGKTRKGYGSIRVNNKTHRAHRVSYEEHIGPIPEGQFVLHKCDNPSCVNPEHLFLGTNQDNINDKCLKGRQSCLKGSRNGNAKLTEDDIKVIRSIKGRSNSSIAREYGVTHVAIGDIVNRKRWQHI